jgi:phage terminase large subunit
LLLSQSQGAGDYSRYANDPLALKDRLWPDVRFYDRQIEVIEAVRDHQEVFVVSAHQMGKDFVSAFISLWFFLTRTPCRVVTTSVRDDHLRVLWGEMYRFIDGATEPLRKEKGGPLLVNHQEIKKEVGGQTCKISYLIGTVARKGEGLAGHHAAHTLFIVDEASGVEDTAYERASTWAKKVLVVGNPYESAGNFFERAVKGGDLAMPPGAA